MNTSNITLDYADLNKMPLLMMRRHIVLETIYRELNTSKNRIQELFDCDQTVHADLELIWMNETLQQDIVGNRLDYQIVIAKVRPGQMSNMHLHEVGGSSGRILGAQHGLVDPTNLVYRTGQLGLSGLKPTNIQEQQVRVGDAIDIPSNLLHQFQNNSDQPSHLLLVTHPKIYITDRDDSDVLAINRDRSDIFEFANK